MRFEGLTAATFLLAYTGITSHFRGRVKVHHSLDQCSQKDKRVFFINP